MSDDFFWSRSPLLQRLSELRDDVRMFMVYGAESWIQQVTLQQMEEAGVTNMERININIIPEARHHVYADQFKLFNDIVVRYINDS